MYKYECWFTSWCIKILFRHKYIILQVALRLVRHWPAVAKLDAFTFIHSYSFIFPERGWESINSMKKEYLGRASLYVVNWSKREIWTIGQHTKKYWKEEKWWLWVFAAVTAAAAATTTAAPVPIWSRINGPKHSVYCRGEGRRQMTPLRPQKDQLTTKRSQGALLVRDNHVFNGLLGRLLCLFARTAHSAH